MRVWQYETLQRMYARMSGSTTQRNNPSSVRTTGTAAQSEHIAQALKSTHFASNTIKHKDWRSTFGKVQSTDLHRHRLIVGAILQTDTAHALIATAIILSIVTVVLQTDAQAANEEIPSWVSILDYVLLGVYSLELCMRLYAGRWWFFREVFNMLDVAVLGIDVVLEVAHWIAGSKDMESISFLRIARLARILRGYRVLMMLPMLSLMVKDLVGALQAVLWGSCLLVSSLTVSSILAVRFINPIVEELTENGVYDGCERCHRAYSSVFQSNLTFLQQIVAGDSWGLVTVPIIEHRPVTVLFFLPVLIIVNLGIMNVILAVIVETAQDARQNDMETRIQHKQDHFEINKKKFVRLCAEIDEDGSGDLSLDELMQGFQNNEELAMTMHDMGIELEDMKTIFEIMDEDRSGTVNYREFAEHIHKMRTADETTVLNFIRHYVMQILRRVNEGKSRGSTMDLERISIPEAVGKTYSNNNPFSLSLCQPDKAMVMSSESGANLKLGRSNGSLGAMSMGHVRSIGKTNSETADSSTLKDLYRDEVNAVFLRTEVAALRDMCDKISKRVEMDLMQEIYSLSKQSKDQMSILSAIKAQSEATRRRDVESDLSARGGGERERGDRERLNGLILPPAHSGRYSTSKAADGCVSVFSKCTTTQKAMHSPRPLSPIRPPRSPKNIS